jgi:hypothetical protein
VYGKLLPGQPASVYERRILMTHWVTHAWEKVHKELKDTIIKTFRQVGLSLNPDGSEDSELNEMGDTIEVQELEQEEDQGDMMTDSGDDTDVRFDYDSGSDFDDEIDNDEQEGGCVMD